MIQALEHIAKAGGTLALIGSNKETSPTKHMWDI